MPVSTSQIQNAYVAFFNRPADTAGLNYWSSYAGSSADLLTTFAQSSEYTSLFTGLNNTQAVNLIYNNLFGRDADLSGLNYWVGQLTAGSVKIANIADAVNKGAQGTDSTIITSKTTAATAFTTSLDTVAKVVAYSSVSTSGLAAVKTWLSAVKDATTLATATSSSGLSAITATVSSSATSTVAGSTFTLTTGTNSFTGASGDDTFDGGISSSSLQTLNSGDSLDGGAGNDTLYAVITGSVTPSALKNIENVNVTNTTTGATIDFSNATGLSAVTNSASTVALNMSGISKSGPTVTVRDTAIAGQVVAFSDVTGSADSATVVINNVVSGATLTVAGVETLTLKSDGSTANVITTLTTANTTSLNITGSIAMNVGTLGSTITKLDASGSTLTGTGVTAIMAATSANTITGSAGNDTLTIVSTGADSISAGAGNDSIQFSTGTWTAADTIDGGAGNDTLRVLATTIAGAATPTTYATTNVEFVQITDALAAAVYTPANISATATELNITGNTSSTGATITTGAALSVSGATIVGPAGSFSIGLGASLATNVSGTMATGTLTITDTGTATTDSLTITNNAMQTAGAMLNVFQAQILPITGYETVTINTGSTAGVQQTLAAITLTGDQSANTTLKFTGVNSVQLTGTATATTIDASGITASGTAATAGGSAFFMTAAPVATTVTGSGGIDVLYGHASSASSITGGAGADSITAGSGNDTVIGGTGNDSITSGAGNDSILGGDGDDTITVGANLASGDVIDGGAGTDTLLASAAIAAAAAASISNIEVISFSATAGQDMTAFLNGGITTVGATAGTLTVTNAQTNLTSMVVGVSGAGLWTGASVTRLVDGTADSFSLLVVDGSTNPTVATASFANEETLTIGESGTDSTAALTVVLGTVTATSLATLNITGSNNHTMTLSGNTALKTINASAATGTLAITDNDFVTSGNSAVAMTVTGPTTTAMTVTGGSGSDSITGGSAADSMVGGAGNDTIIGNAGNDTITGSAGIDSLVGGDGTDTISAAYTLVTDGGSTVGTGVVINLSSSAVLSTTIAATFSIGAAGATLGTSGDISSVAANTQAYTGTSATVSSRVDTLSGFENITGSAGKDYLVGSTSANTITSGLGADYQKGSGGVDTFVFTAGTQSAPFITAFAADSMTSGALSTDAIVATSVSTAADAEVIEDIETGDIINLGILEATFATTATVGLLTDDTFSYVAGTWVNSTGVFTIGATTTTGADTMLMWDADTAGTFSVNQVILVGVTATELAAATFSAAAAATTGATITF